MKKGREGQYRERKEELGKGMIYNRRKKKLVGKESEQSRCKMENPNMKQSEVKGVEKGLCAADDS